MSVLLHRLTGALIGAAAFCLLAAIPFLVTYVASLITAGGEGSTIGEMLERMAGVPLAEWGAAGPIVGAATGKAAAAAFVAAGNCLVTAAEWCTRRAKRRIE